MRRFPWLPLSLGLVVTFPFAINIKTIAFAQEDDPYPPCSPVNRLTSSNGAAWAHNASVMVLLSANDFTPAQRQAIEAAFHAWENANTNSGVTFSFSTTTSTTGPGRR